MKGNKKAKIIIIGIIFIATICICSTIAIALNNIESVYIRFNDNTGYYIGK